MDHQEKAERVSKALDSFRIEIPSWGFANTGTRFGKFLQAGAANSIEEKFADAAEINRLTGVTSTMGLHVEWDLPDGVASVPWIQALEKKYRICAGSINPNLFQAQEYKSGSICNPDAAVRHKALAHLLDCVEIARQLGSQDISPWVSDGSNYPGTQSMRKRIGWMEEIFSQVHAALQPDQRLLIEYKPFEPAFYHTDIADWGMALELARLAGPQAKVLVDTGHHYQAQNIEQIVAWLLHLEMLGGFHLNDRRYADDDLTLGSIDPYQVFRIFHEILSYSGEPDFLHAALDTTACAAFSKESHMNFADANQLHRKSGEPDFLHAALDTTACAAFSKESHMNFADANQLHRKSGEPGNRSQIAFMIDQSHNLKGKVEAMVQTVVQAQELYAKAALVDLEQLDILQKQCRLVEAEELFRSAFWEDVRPLVGAWRLGQSLPEDPLRALSESGYVERISSERAARNASISTSYA
jgi:L-rhamnose isomerase